MQTLHTLPSELSIYTVGELHPQWLAWLAEEGADETLAIHGGGVEQADAAGVQLLLALAASLKKRGTALALHDASPALQQACSALGLADWAASVATTLAISDRQGHS
jgi:anti-anti-sigma regulatory factor